MDGGRRIVVATITVGTNERTWLDACLGSLTASDTASFDLLVYYVDNASTDGSVSHVERRFPSVRVIRNSRNLGFSAANNVALRLALNAGADFIFLVNPDTQSPRSLLRCLMEFMLASPTYGIVGPMQYRYESGAEDLVELNDWSTLALQSGERHAFAGDWPDHPSPASPLAGRAPRTLEHAYVQGSALFARAAMLRTTGLFDEVFHTYYEEVDLCRRARWAGWRVALLLDLGIQHVGSGGAGQGRYRRVQMRRNRFYYLLTDVEWPLTKALRLAARWLRAELRGDGVGGRTTRPVAMWETGVAMAWLLARLPEVANRRRRYQQLGVHADSSLAALNAGDPAALTPRPKPPAR